VSGHSAATAAAVASLALTAAACGGADESPGRDRPATPSDERVIRQWSASVNRGDYDRAADLFADGAVVEQVTEVRLETHDDAVAFNRGLPCRADVTDVEEQEDGALAAFELREGRTGECGEGGRARVLFVISDGEIEEWRQLPALPAPEGDTA
jgi:hypothetical protein